MTGARVAVVGGGLAGIAAALECADRGLQTTLHERRGVLGGATFSVRREGLWLDNGQHVFLRCCTAYRAFLRRIGAERETVLQSRLEIPMVMPGGRSGRLRRGPLPAPLHLLPCLFALPGLAAGDRLALARAMLALRAVDPLDPGSDRVSFGDWLRDHGQSQALVEAVWQPIALPALNLPPDEASLAMAAVVFRTGLLDTAAAGDLGWSRVPLRRLHGDRALEALRRAGVDVHCGERVTGVERAGDGFAVASQDAFACVDAVIVALPAAEAPAVCPDGALDAGAVRALGDSPIVNLHVVYDRPVTKLPLAAAIKSPVQWVFDRTESAGADHGQVLAISLSAAGEHAGRSLEDLRERFLPELARLFPRAAEARVESFFVTREPRATFRAAPCSGGLRPAQRTPLPGLYLAGAWTDTGWPATMEGAVRSGRSAAAALTADLGQRRMAGVVA